jgi:hypothetical protein
MSGAIATGSLERAWIEWESTPNATASRAS